jgi:hypothetical protein
MDNFQSTVNFLRSKIVILDCNVLLLLIVGIVDKKHIPKFKRTNVYSGQDYETLVELIKHSKIVVTPNVLTEASNLLESYNNQYGDYSIFLGLRNFINSCDEKYFKSAELASQNSFLKLGLADISVVEVCKKGAIAITTDGKLFAFLSSSECGVINFNHVISNL